MIKTLRSACRGAHPMLYSLFILCFMVTVLPLQTAHAAEPRTAQEASDEWDFVDLLNQARADAGLGPLGVVAQWRETSRDHSERMATEGRLFHDLDDEVADANAMTSCWSNLGENVAQGFSVQSIHDAWMNSSGHRANILGDFQYVGIGVERRPDTTLWVTQRFLKLQSGCAPLATESEAADFSLTVFIQGPGIGTVTSSPPGINCGTDCSEVFPQNTTVTLTAVAGTNSTFVGWSGAGCTGTSTCTVVMDTPPAKSVTAMFDGDVTAPVSRIGVPRHGATYKRGSLRKLSGSATDSGTGVEQVEIALRKKLKNGDCLWLVGNEFRRGNCLDQRWNNATGGETWSHNIPALQRSVKTKVDHYMLFARATDAVGNIEQIFKKGRNRNRFEVI